MHPEVLVRMAADCVFNTQVRAGSICYLIAAGVVFQHGFKIKVVVTGILAAEMAEGYDRSAGFLGNPCSGGHGSRGYTEERGKHTVIAPVILIGDIPDLSVC